MLSIFKVLQQHSLLCKNNVVTVNRKLIDLVWHEKPIAVRTVRVTEECI